MSDSINVTIRMDRNIKQQAEDIHPSFKELSEEEWEWHKHNSQKSLLLAAVDATMDFYETKYSTIQGNKITTYREEQYNYDGTYERDTTENLW